MKSALYFVLYLAGYFLLFYVVPALVIWPILFFGFDMDWLLSLLFSGLICAFITAILNLPCFDNVIPLKRKWKRKDNGA